MITRSKLVEQLRDYQIRSQHKCSPLTIFSPTPVLYSCILEIACSNVVDLTRADVAVAIFSATLFGVLVVSSCVFFYFRHFWLSLFVLCLGICLPIRLRSCRQAVTRKRDRRLLLPLSM